MRLTNLRDNTVQGIFNEYANNTEYTKLLSFMDSYMNSRINTAMIAKVVRVNPGSGAIGKVSVEPLVFQLDAQNNAIPQGIIYNISYFRYHGGNAAVIIDPVVGDIGLVIFTKSDSSLINENTTNQQPPGSLRSFDSADGFYFGCPLAKAPDTLIRLNQDRTIDIVATQGINVTGTITVNGDVIANGISLTTHIHGGVQSGGSTTSQPVG